jgi:hypothetical protein
LRHAPNALRQGLSAIVSEMLASFTTPSYAATRAFQNLCAKRSSHESFAASASWAASSPIANEARGDDGRAVSLPRLPRDTYVRARRLVAVLRRVRRPRVRRASRRGMRCGCECNG